ncbi:IS3 family transposase [Pseudoalteromonas sp. MSK9-3]|uniref:IS3 family transposase n=1 Tax=Pseudoalteromonas sp. MSK9-3 TaxID=1897633 RepID=UPI002175D0F2|nr:IS3 family transposase [Pseudoalteromonas sp. MSK9-3]
MKHYPEDHKQAVIRKLVESGLSLGQFAKQESINLSTLYSWRDKYLKVGSSLTESNSLDGWSPEQKFSIVLETAALSEIELSEYCREKGLYPEQVKEWRQSCIEGNQTQAQQRKQLTQERKADHKRIKELEKELKRKDAALAETAALLVLRKKFKYLLGGRRGQLTSHSDRQYYASLIDDAVTSGARKERACEEIGLSIRTLQRWQEQGEIIPDKRPTAKRPEPKNKLTEEEQQAILDISNQEEYANLGPSQIVPMLADSGQYIASESSFYRVLKANDQLTHRGKAKPKNSRVKPRGYTATGPNQVWTWDISYCPSTVIGRFFYLYMIIDIFSRKIVGWEVHDSESGEYAAELLERTLWAEKCVKQNVVLHSDNGSPMKCLTMQAKMLEMGIIGSRSRPGVSNDNPYSGSLFRTIKYSHRWPSEGFKHLEDARSWVKGFTNWYNNTHRHSRIKFVTPGQRHSGEDRAILAKRRELYKKAQEKNANRWSKHTRNWDEISDVELNPENKREVA